MTNLNIKSKEELYFLWYLEELKENNFIFNYKYEPKPFVLNEELTSTVVEESIVKRGSDKGKVKRSSKNKVLIPSRTYTCDYLINWNISAKDIFFFDITKPALKDNKNIFGAQWDNTLKLYFSYIEIKPSFDKFNMERLVKNNIAFVWQKEKIYVNIIKPYSLFSNSFYPKRFEYTDKNDTVKRKYKGKYVQDLNQSLKDFKNEFYKHSKNLLF